MDTMQQFDSLLERIDFGNPTEVKLALLMIARTDEFSDEVIGELDGQIADLQAKLLPLQKARKAMQDLPQAMRDVLRERIAAHVAATGDLTICDEITVARVKRYEYDDTEALDYALEHVPEAVKHRLGKREFNKWLDGNGRDWTGAERVHSVEIRISKLGHLLIEAEHDER